MIHASTAMARCEERDAEKKSKDIKVRPVTATSGSLTPLWTNPDVTIVPFHRQSKFEDSLAMRINTCQFQSALKRGDLEELASFMEGDRYPINNSKAVLTCKTNPIRLWARMPNIGDGAAEDGKSLMPENTSSRVKTLFEIILEQLLLRLMQTGAAPFLNEQDPNDGARPIDIALSPQRCLLIRRSKLHGINLSPTSTHFPLYEMIRADFDTSWCSYVLDSIDPACLDWVDVHSGYNLLYFTMSREIQHSAFLSELAAYTAFLNPCAPCFTNSPIVFPANSYWPHALCAMQEEWSAYKRIHLPNQIVNRIPLLVPSLIVLVIEYCM